VSSDDTSSRSCRYLRSVEFKSVANPHDNWCSTLLTWLSSFQVEYAYRPECKVLCSFFFSLLFSPLSLLLKKLSSLLISLSISSEFIVELNTALVVK
jgi:hypothetical protein